MKKRIAIWMHGGVGGGYYGQGIPAISMLVEDLSANFDITIYSQFQAAQGFIPQGYLFYSVHSSVKATWLRWFYLIALFIKHYFQKKYDVLYAFWGFPAGFIAVNLGILFRKPSIVHLQGGDAVFIPAIRYGLLQGFLKKKMILWAYRKSSSLIALTQFQKDSLQKFGLSRSIEIIPFGANMHLFRFKANFNPHLPVRFLHVANLTPVKDQVTLLQVFAEITKHVSSELKIVGGDDLHGKIHNYCRELNLESKVLFLGVQPYETMPSYYEWADVLLHTSLYEGQCLAVTEAAASGVLIAGTRTGLIADWGDTCAVIAEVHGCERLTENVLRVLVNLHDGQKYIDNARNKAAFQNRSWTYEKIRDQINSLTCQ